MPIISAGLYRRRRGLRETHGRCAHERCRIRGTTRYDAIARIPGIFGLSARKETLVGAFAQPIAVDATDVVDDVEIVLSQGLTLEGFVTSTSGRPVPLKLTVVRQ